MDPQTPRTDEIPTNTGPEGGDQVIHHPQDRPRVDPRPVVDLVHLLVVQAHIPVPVLLDPTGDMGMGMGMDMEEGMGEHK